MISFQKKQMRKIFWFGFCQWEARMSPVYQEVIAYILCSSNKNGKPQSIYFDEQSWFL